MRKTAFIISILISSNIIANAQKIPTHEKKIYVSPDHKIFYNKSLPVYFFISTSPDPSAPHYLLQSETTPKYANPMYFDTEGRNTLRSPSAVDTITKKVVEPKIDVQYQIYVDSKPPSTRIVYNKQKEKIMRGIHFISDSLSVSFAANDELSGVENTYVSIDSGDYQPVQRHLELDKEKLYTIKYYSVDHTGNVEKPREIKFSVDKTPPVSKLNITGQKYEDILPGNASIEVSASDDISGVKRIFISIDDSIFHPYTGKISTSLLQQGDHKLYYYATDEVDNTEKLNTYTFYIDKTPPQVIEEIIGKTFVANGREYSAGTSTLKINSFDNKAGVKEIFYSINHASYIKYEKPILLTGYKGDLLVTSYAIDNVGNRSQSDVSNSRKNVISYIDLGAPWVGHTLKGPNFLNRDTVFVSNRTNIILEAKDSESGVNRIEYQIDSSDLKTYNNPISLLKEGFHRISVFGYDNTENLTRQEFGVEVDTTGPQIFERFSTLPVGKIEKDGEILDQYFGPVVVFLSATDTKSGFESLMFQLNNGPLQPYLRDIRGFIQGGINRVRAKAIDKLGNQTEKLIEFYLK